jgi:hypothetical protein
MKALNALIKTDESITAVIDGVPKTMTQNHPSFTEALTCLATGDIDSLDALFDVSTSITRKFNSDGVEGIEIADGVIYYNDEPLHNYVVDRIFEFMQEGLPFKPVAQFLIKLMENPSRRAVEELYKFLEHKHLPICEDGDFLAYKSVREDYKDQYSGTFYNGVGEVLEMPRNAVCDDADVGCSFGFHAGSYEYAKNFGCGNSRLVIVKINPADVVSVPKDCDCQKLRTSRYEVVKDFERVYRSPLNTEFTSCEADEGDGCSRYDDEDEQSCGDSYCNYHNLRDSKGRFMRKR